LISGQQSPSGQPEEGGSMLNASLGKTGAIDGALSISTRRGAAGHALYGPYARLEPGDYAVEFDMTVIGNDMSTAGPAVCAIIDVASNVGNTVRARRELSFSDILLNESGAFCLAFHLDEISGDTEFRVYVTGETELRIANYCRTHRLPDPGDNYVDFFNGTKFPGASAWQAADVPSSLVPPLRQIYEKGGEIRIENGHAVATLDGVSFNVATPDDLRFVGEIFYRNTYNALLNRAACVIDIGMNIGLVSLRLAKNPVVNEVHAFEPFRGTYERALANIGLNSDVSDKIFTYNFGLSGKDEELTVLIRDETDSGAFSIRGDRTGSPKKIAVRNAASALEPIIRSAKKRRLDIIAKIDCEGSEFRIFEQLDAHKLLPDITAFMVEWHRGSSGQTQHDLMKPLLRHGFLIFDISPKEGNGFFYAVRTSRSPL
jgi:FkbM family methyltransferase